MTNSIFVYHLSDDSDDDDKFIGFATTNEVIDVAVSTDVTWQKRGHQAFLVFRLWFQQ